jgi:hypothetical protein
LEGDPTKTYRVKLRIEGVVEPKTYVGGRSDGAFWQEGGAPSGNGWATFALQVSDPPQTYFLNRTNQVGIYTFPIGYEKEIVMASNAQLTLSTHSIDGRQAAANQFVRVTPVGITALR